MPGIAAPTEHLAVPLADQHLPSGPVLLAWHRFGPYHHARARAAARHLPIVGLEISAVDQVNAWAPVEGAEGFQKITLCPNEAVDGLSASVLERRMDQALAKINPRVVVVHGYATRDALALLSWADRHGRHAILMSESNARDDNRIWWRERLKRRLVRLCSAGLVGGSVSKHYLEQLGLPSARIFVGYDVVDNAHFMQAHCMKTLAHLGLFSPFFLASGRFIEKKNIFRLIQAYAIYRSNANEEVWRLAIVGDGPLRPKIESAIGSLDLGGHVILPGYKQYDELPVWYHAASCFILPSTTEQWGLVVNEAMAAGLPVLVSNRCGCAVDLVREGVNGFTFDSYDVQQLADLMWQMAHGNINRAAMGRASQDIIASWGPERFAEGLAKAVDVALAAPPPRLTLSDRALLWTLIRR